MAAVNNGRFVGGIRAGYFEMQVGSVRACVLREVRNSLLQWSVTYCGTVQGYQPFRYSLLR